MLIVIPISTCDVDFDWPLISDRLLSVLDWQVSPFASQDGREDVLLDSLREFYVRIERYFGHFTTPNKLWGK